MSNLLSFSQSVRVINNYKDMTSFEMSSSFSIDETNIRIFLQSQGLEAKTNPLSVKKRIYDKRDEEEEDDKIVIVRPAAVYSNRSQEDVWGYYESL